MDYLGLRKATLHSASTPMQPEGLTTQPESVASFPSRST